MQFGPTDIEYAPNALQIPFICPRDCKSRGAGNKEKLFLTNFLRSDSVPFINFPTTRMDLAIFDL